MALSSMHSVFMNDSIVIVPLPFSHIVGLLHDFQILYTDVQIFKLGSHYVLKIQVY